MSHVPNAFVARDIEVPIVRYALVDFVLHGAVTSSSDRRHPTSTIDDEREFGSEDVLIEYSRFRLA